jgi:chromosomal replication initiation ATPase DnaA
VTDSYAYDEKKMLAGIASYRAEVEAAAPPPPPLIAVLIREAPAPLSVNCKRVEAVLDEPARLKMTVLVERVATEYGVSVGELRSRTNERRIVNPRQIAIYLVRQHTQASLHQIGDYFRKHHTTALHSVDKVRWMAAADEKLAATLRRLARPERRRA